MNKVIQCVLSVVILILVASGVFCWYPNHSFAAYSYPLLEPIPGFDLQDCPNPPVPGSQCTPLFFRYVQAIYQFGIWTVGIAALLMITIGGFMYMTSAGNTSRIGSARAVIWNAIIGLVGALTAYVILYVINPDLVNVDLTSLIGP